MTNTYYHNGKRKKKKVRYRKKRVAMLLAGFIGICAAITLSTTDCSSCSHQEPEEKEIPQTHLNDTLTNSMSDAPTLEGMEKELKRYFERWELNGAQIAISRGDSLLYVKGFGWADKEAGLEMQPSNIMRLASVSKLLTAVGIMKLVDDKKIKLSEHVFGAKGILNDTAFTNVIKDPT